LGGASTVSCSIDGLVDATGKVVYNVVFYLPEPYFVASFRLGAEAATAENLRSHLLAALATPLAARVSRFDLFPGAARPSREVYLASRQLLAFCSDNPTVMQSLRRLVVDSDMALFAYGCAAHAANLVGKDLAAIEPFRAARINAVIIIVFFTRSTRAMAMLSANVQQLRTAGERVPYLQTYSRTRWVGETASIASVVGSIGALRRTLSDNIRIRPRVAIPAAVTAAVNEPGPLAEMGRALPFLKMLSKCVATIEADSAPLSTVAGVFCALRLCLSSCFSDLPVATRTAIQASIAARYSLIHDPMLALAFYLDPFWVGVRMRGAALEWSGKTFIFLREAGLDCWAGDDVEYRARLSADLASFLAHVESLPFGSDGVGGHPCHWWRLHGEAFSTLRPLAMRILLLPPSAAGGERSFKVFNRALTRLRNRLSPTKADMQTRIAFNSAQMDRADVVRAYRRTHLELDLLVKLGLTPVGAAAGEAAAAGGVAAAAGALAGEAEVDGRGAAAGDGGAVVEGGGDGEDEGIALGMQADAETPAEEEEPPVVEGDGAIENLGTEEFDTVVHNAGPGGRRRR